MTTDLFPGKRVSYSSSIPPHLHVVAPSTLHPHIAWQRLFWESRDRLYPSAIKIGLGVDVGARHLGLHLCLLDGQAPAWPPKQGAWPSFRELYKANVDLDAVTPELVINSFVDWSRSDAVRAQFMPWLPLVSFVAIERQIGGSVTFGAPGSESNNNQTSGNPRMVAISHALQLFFVLHCTKPGFVFRFVNHSQTEPLFEKQFELKFPYETKRRGKALSQPITAHRQYANRKNNSEFLARQLYQHNRMGVLPMPIGVRAIDVYEAMIMFMTMLFRYVAVRVPKPRKRRKDAKEEPEPSGPATPRPAKRARIALPADAFAEPVFQGTTSMDTDGFEILTDWQ